MLKDLDDYVDGLLRACKLLGHKSIDQTMDLLQIPLRIEKNILTAYINDFKPCTKLTLKTMILIAIILPWLSFLIRGKIIIGILCLFLQITLIGWLPAALWAAFSYINSKNEKRLKELEQKVIN